jgi:hypothetical protein
MNLQANYIFVLTGGDELVINKNITVLKLDLPRDGRYLDRISVGEKFFGCLKKPWGPHSLLNNGYRVSFKVEKLPGHGVDLPPQSSADVKENVELCLQSPFGPP